MKILMAALILSLATPVMASPIDDDRVMSAVLTHCLRRLTGSTEDSSMCELAFFKVSDSAKQIADGKTPTPPVPAKDEGSECSGYSYEFGIDYVPVYYGKSRIKACVPMDQVPALLEATKPYR